MDQTFSRNAFAPYKDICLGKQNRDMYESVNTTFPNTLACTRTGYSCVWKVTSVVCLFPETFCLQRETIRGTPGGVVHTGGVQILSSNPKFIYVPGSI